MTAGSGEGGVGEGEDEEEVGEEGEEMHWWRCLWCVQWVCGWCEGSVRAFSRMKAVMLF